MKFGIGISLLACALPLAGCGAEETGSAQGAVCNIRTPDLTTAIQTSQIPVGSMTETQPNEVYEFNGLGCDNAAAPSVTQTAAWSAFITQYGPELAFASYSGMPVRPETTNAALALLGGSGFLSEIEYYPDIDGSGAGGVGIEFVHFLLNGCVNKVFATQTFVSTISTEKIEIVTGKVTGECKKGMKTIAKVEIIEKTATTWDIRVTYSDGSVDTEAIMLEPYPHPDPEVMGGTDGRVFCYGNANFWICKNQEGEKPTPPFFFGVTPRPANVDAIKTGGAGICTAEAAGDPA